MGNLQTILVRLRTWGGHRRIQGPLGILSFRRQKIPIFALRIVCKTFYCGGKKKNAMYIFQIIQKPRMHWKMFFWTKKSFWTKKRYSFVSKARNSCICISPRVRIVWNTLYCDGKKKNATCFFKSLKNLECSGKCFLNEEIFILPWLCVLDVLLIAERRKGGEGRRG